MNVHANNKQNVFFFFQGRTANLTCPPCARESLCMDIQHTADQKYLILIVSLLWSPDWPRSYYTDQAGLKIKAICLPLLLSARIKGLSHYTSPSVTPVHTWTSPWWYKLGSFQHSGDREKDSREFSDILS